MSMIDFHGATGTFADTRKLAPDAVAAIETIEQIRDIAILRENRVASVHEHPAEVITSMDGDHDDVRVHVLTNADALDRGKQIAVVRQLTDLVAPAANNPGLTRWTWVTVSAPGSGVIRL
jgi:hypothetical protein